jgi:FlaA1/EpsC-like NDP-sugar epimerase
MIKLSGLDEKTIEVKFIGVRRGEKLHENLVGPDEDLLTTSDRKISIVRPWRVDIGRWSRGVDELIELAKKRDNPGITSRLMELVPTFRPSEEFPGRLNMIESNTNQ